VINGEDTLGSGLFPSALAQANAWSAAVLVDELDAGILQGTADT
jgi:hypothetical protein